MNTLRPDIEDAYSRRDRSKGDRYGWWQPDVINQHFIRDMAFRRFLHDAFGADLSKIDVLDAGCGHGGLLRSLIECFVDPSRMIGVDMLSDRIETRPKDILSRSHMK